MKGGALFYDYAIQSARADYYDWCIPLFDGNNGGDNIWNHTCSFLMTSKGAYFIRSIRLTPQAIVQFHLADVLCCSPTFPIKEDRCCYFAEIPPPTPDWLKNTKYNTTEVSGQLDLFFSWPIKAWP